MAAHTQGSYHIRTVNIAKLVTGTLVFTTPLT